MFFIDIQNAFDTVNHSILSAKAEYYGVRGIVLEWFKSYLRDRDQYASINETNSTPLEVTPGVSQGSVLTHYCFIYLLMTYQLSQRN